MTRSNVIPMVLFAAIVVSLGINTPQAANEIIARLFNKSLTIAIFDRSSDGIGKVKCIVTLILRDRMGQKVS